MVSGIGNPEFPGISGISLERVFGVRHFLGEGFWGPQIAISGEDEVDMCQ